MQPKSGKEERKEKMKQSECVLARLIIRWLGGDPPGDRADGIKDGTR